MRRLRRFASRYLPLLLLGGVASGAAWIVHVDAAHATPPLEAVRELVSGQTPTQTTETLVLTTAVELPRLSGRKGIEIQNLGPNAIYCSLGTSTGLAVGKGRMIAASGGTWALDASEYIRIFCLAATAAQVTTAATMTNELR